MSNVKNKIQGQDIKNEGLLDNIAIAMPPEANLQLADPLLVTYYTDKKNRVLWIDKDIDDSLMDEIKTIVQWNREDEQNNVPVEERVPIKLFIHSFGGQLDLCFAMIDIINLSKTPIWTINMNSCLSAGCLIFINGHKGHRYCMPLSTALIHQGSGGSSGEFSAVVAQTENYKKLISMMKDNILQHTTINKSMLTKNSKKEWYLYADDQIKYGLADEIITDITKIL